MSTKTPERELSLIQKALGEQVDPKIWPKRLTAAGAVQRLVNLVTESDHLRRIAELEGQIDDLEGDKAAILREREAAVSKSVKAEAEADDARKRLEVEREKIAKLTTERDRAQNERNEFRTQWQEEIDRSTRLEQALADAKAESVLALADRVRETVVGFRERVKARFGRA